MSDGSESSLVTEMGQKDRYRRSESPGALQDHPGSMDDAPIGVGASAYTAVAPADRGHFSEHGRPTGSDQFRGEDPPQFSGPAGPGVSPGKKSNFPPVPSTLTPSAPHAILEPGRQLFELSHEEVLRTQRRRAKHAGSAYRHPSFKTVPTGHRTRTTQPPWLRFYAAIRNS